MANKNSMLENITEKINNIILKQHKVVKVLILLIPVIFFSYCYTKLVTKNERLYNKNAELIFLENEHKNIVSNNNFVMELEKNKNHLINLIKSIEERNTILYDNFKKYQWNQIDNIVANNFIKTRIYMKNESEILLYGTEDFLDIFNKIENYESLYPKYKIDFFKYDGYDKNYKFRLSNIEKDVK